MENELKELRKHLEEIKQQQQNQTTNISNDEINELKQTVKLLTQQIATSKKEEKKDNTNNMIDTGSQAFAVDESNMNNSANNNANVSQQERQQLLRQVAELQAQNNYLLSVVPSLEERVDHHTDQLMRNKITIGISSTTIAAVKSSADSTTTISTAKLSPTATSAQRVKPPKLDAETRAQLFQRGPPSSDAHNFS